MTDTSRYRYETIGRETADRYRADPAHRRITVRAKPGSPCRACLRDAEVGESLVLVAHDPFPMESPFSGSTAIYLHESCEPQARNGTAPEMFRSRTLSLRAFDCEFLLRQAGVVDGADLEGALDDLFTDERVETVHVHTAAEGCWHCAVRRA